MKPLLPVCAWCFKGLLTIDGQIVSHGICGRHRAELEMRIWLETWEKILWQNVNGNGRDANVTSFSDYSERSAWIVEQRLN